MRRIFGYYIVKESELEALAEKYAKERCKEQKFRENVGWLTISVLEEINKRLRII